jgi:glycosyltransferase involved in cell wall biosynthesis
MINYGISVIICVHNGARRIIPTLKALAEQNIPPGLACELLIIDNASTDDTANIAANYWATLSTPISLRILYELKPGKANALIMGYNDARYELMLLCDDDNWLQPDYMKCVSEIYTLHPQIGLLGGYGKAFFGTSKKPYWFDYWENYFVCGEHFKESGYLKQLDIRIWGAGSVLRKTMWNYLKSSGFSFVNSRASGKAMTEDAELSQIITYTGHQLYFDNRLWFYHDLHDREITIKNVLKQQFLNGKNGAVLFCYWKAYYCENKSNLYFVRGILKYIIKIVLTFFTKWGNMKNIPEFVFSFSLMKEVIFNFKKYYFFFNKSLVWINKIKESYPLK